MDSFSISNFHVYWGGLVLSNTIGILYKVCGSESKLWSILSRYFVWCWTDCGVVFNWLSRDRDIFSVRFFFPLSTNGAQKWKAGFSFFTSIVNLLVQSDDAFNCHLSLIGRALKDSSNSPDPSALLLRCVLESNSKQQNRVNKSLWVMQHRTYSFFLITQSSIFCFMLVLRHLIYGIKFLGTW